MPQKEKKEEEKYRRQLPPKTTEKDEPEKNWPEPDIRATDQEDQEGSVPPEKVSDRLDLGQRIGEAAEGLFYLSETDAEIEPFAGERAEEVTAAEILRQIGQSGKAPIERREFEDFFRRLTEIPHWYEEEEKDQARKFRELKDLLKKELRDIKVFRIGKIEIDIYVVGLDRDGRLAGIKTQAVET